MNNLRTILTFLAIIFASESVIIAQTVDEISLTRIIADLIRPNKLATLKTRGANSRLQKVVYWIEIAKQNKYGVSDLLSNAVVNAGYTNSLAAKLTHESLLKNHQIATRYNCLDSDGLSEMRRGKAPSIKQGEFYGDQLSVDHIIPISLCPELDSVIANLELMPMRANARKKNRIEIRQVESARNFANAGLLSAEGLNKVVLAQR